MTAPREQGRRHRGEGEIFQVGRIWYCRYSVKGVRRKESSNSARRADAVALLNRRRAEIAGRKKSQKEDERVTFDDLAKLVRDNYALNELRSGDRLERAFVHLRAEFEHTRAVDITTPALTAYAVRRKASGAKAATIVYELAALKRGFRLAMSSTSLGVPVFPKIRVSNARQGFLSDAEFASIMSQLSNRAYVAPLTFAYLTGWRLASEVLTLKWSNVDLAEGMVKLAPNTVTKNKEARTLPTRPWPEIHALLEAQRDAVSQLEKETGTRCALVFPRLNGGAIKSLRGAWDAACVRAGLDKRPDVGAPLLHDMRRSAAKRFTAAGASRGQAMALAGWKTESIFNRYDIVNVDDMSAGLEKVARLRAEKAAQPE